MTWPPLYHKTYPSHCGERRFLPDTDPGIQEMSYPPYRPDRAPSIGQTVRTISSGYCGSYRLSCTHGYPRSLRDRLRCCGRHRLLLPPIYRASGFPHPLRFPIEAARYIQPQKNAQYTPCRTVRDNLSPAHHCSKYLSHRSAPLSAGIRLQPLPCHPPWPEI